MLLTDEVKTLVEDNRKFIFYFCRKYNLKMDDWYGDLAVILCETAAMYLYTRPDLQKYAFGTILVWKFRSYYSHTFRNKNRNDFQNNILSLDYIYDNGNAERDTSSWMEPYDKYNQFEDIELIEIFKEFYSRLNVNEKKLLHMRANGYNQTSIAKELGVSQITISRKIHKLQKLYYDIRNDIN